MCKQRYYSIIFQFQGKEKCMAGSASFYISDDANENQLIDACEAAAKADLQRFFKDIFPDEALEYLRKPKIIKCIPAPLDFQKTKEDFGNLRDWKNGR